MEKLSRRSFLKGAGAMGFGMGMMPILSILGVDAKAEAEGVESAVAGLKHFANIKESDELKQAVLTESEVTSDLTMSDGTVIPAVYVRMRNRINRIGKGIGSIPSANGYQMIMELWSEEDAENYLKMPLHQAFTANDYAAKAGISEEKASEILEDQAHRNLIWRMVRGGLPTYALMPYINGFWEFGELDRLLHGTMEDVAKFDMLGIGGADPNSNGWDTTFPLFRAYPISKDVVAEGELKPFEDWRAIIKRHKMITVSPCQCRTMWQALGVPYPENHPMNTCLSFGEMAEYFIENDIGKQITQDEAIAIVEDVISKGMVVEAICAKNPDIICCCHSESCGNLMGWRGANGQGAFLDGFLTVVGVHLIAPAVTEGRGGTGGIPEGAVEGGGVLGAVAHDGGVDISRLVQGLTDCLDVPVHHVAGGHHVCPGFGIADGDLREDLEGLVV